MRERNERAGGGVQQPARPPRRILAPASRSHSLSPAQRPRLANWEYTAGYVSRYSRLPIPSH